MDPKKNIAEGWLTAVHQGAVQTPLLLELPGRVWLRGDSGAVQEGTSYMLGGGPPLGNFSHIIPFFSLRTFLITNITFMINGLYQIQ